MEHSGIFARVIWGRKLGQSQAIIPSDFPLTFFHDFKTMSLDRERYLRGYQKIVDAIQTGLIKKLSCLFILNGSLKSTRRPRGAHTTMC